MSWFDIDKEIGWDGRKKELFLGRGPDVNRKGWNVKGCKTLVINHTNNQMNNLRKVKITGIFQ